MQDKFIQAIAPNQKAVRTGNMTKFFYIDKVKEIEENFNSNENSRDNLKTPKTRKNSSKEAKGLTLIDMVMQEHQRLNSKNNKKVIFQNIEPFNLSLSNAKAMQDEMLRRERSNSLGSKDYLDTNRTLRSTYRSHQRKSK